eukprot:TRINITY_DN57231_c0_g1_i1.p1 TRINITY_DN57231_c0_g1~~TRINITY_DN57231_c0_g1_i1.p1  ORF type:complete len:384 (-),score=31.19 TRINITY_DN57231_c0_g1_i1:36-1187(-)
MYITYHLILVACLRLCRGIQPLTRRNGVHGYKDLGLNLPPFFFEEYFGKSSLHIPATASVRELFQTLWGRRQAVRASEYGRFRAAIDGVEFPWIHGFTHSPLKNAEVAWTLNMTLVHNTVESRHDPLVHYLNKFAKFFRLEVHANSYMTPPGGTAFGFHVDLRDSFIIQIEGRKAWQLCDRVSKDLPMHPAVKKMWFALNTSTLSPDDPALEEKKCRHIDMLEGDVLYLPDGQTHRARVKDDDPLSLHLTLGVTRSNPKPVAEYFHLGSTDVTGAKPTKLKTKGKTLDHVAPVSWIDAAEREPASVEVVKVALSKTKSFEQSSLRREKTEVRQLIEAEYPEDDVNAVKLWWSHHNRGAVKLRKHLQSYIELRVQADVALQEEL